MPYTITREPRGTFLHLLLEGEESYADAIQFWKDLDQSSKKEGFTRFLIVDRTQGRLDTTQHYEISVLVSTLFNGRTIAYVDPKVETFESNRFGELVIRNRGGVVALFRTEAEAEAWLTLDAQG